VTIKCKHTHVKVNKIKKLMIPEDIWRSILTTYIRYDEDKNIFLNLIIVNVFFCNILMAYYNRMPVGPVVCFRSTMICTNTCMNCGRDFEEACNQLNFFTDEPPRRIIIYCESLYCFKMAIYSQLDAISKQSGLLYTIRHVVNHDSILEDEKNRVLISRTRKVHKTEATVVTKYVYINRVTQKRYMLCKWYEKMDNFYKLILIDPYLKKDLHLSPF